ncbi:hypothetical protein KCU95_g2306, partial [Aureobasidium melanogenum]
LRPSSHTNAFSNTKNSLWGGYTHFREPDLNLIFNLIFNLTFNLIFNLIFNLTFNLISNLIRKQAWLEDAFLLLIRPAEMTDPPFESSSTDTLDSSSGIPPRWSPNTPPATQLRWRASVSEHSTSNSSDRAGNAPFVRPVRVVTRRLPPRPSVASGTRSAHNNTSQHPRPRSSRSGPGVPSRRGAHRVVLTEVRRSHRITPEDREFLGVFLVGFLASSHRIEITREIAAAFSIDHTDMFFNVSRLARLLAPGSQTRLQVRTQQPRNLGPNST